MKIKTVEFTKKTAAGRQPYCFISDICLKQ